MTSPSTSSSLPPPAATERAWPRAVPELDALFLETIGTIEGRRDPYSRYAALREEAPVYETGLGFFVCTRYEECQFVLRDPRFGKEEADPRGAAAAPTSATSPNFPGLVELSADRRSLLSLNPPDHTRLRRLVSQAFTPRTVEQLRPQIVRLVDDLLDQDPPGDVVDVIDVLAFPLPVAVIGRMLGVPEDDWATVPPGHGAGDGAPGAGHRGRRDRAGPARRSRSSRRTSASSWPSAVVSPADDLLSELIRVQEGGDSLSEPELISTAILLFGAGFETTTNLIGNGLLALLSHPGQLERLRADRTMPTSDDRAPMQSGGRGDVADTTARCSSTVGRPSQTWTWPGCRCRQAGRSSPCSARPTGIRSTSATRIALDLRRHEGPPMSFASGIHFCLGAALARAEGQVVFDRLLERFTSIELATDAPLFRNRITLRGLTELPVSFKA